MAAQTIPKNNEVGHAITGRKFITARVLYCARDIDGIALGNGHKNLFPVEYEGIVLCFARAIP